MKKLLIATTLFLGLAGFAAAQKPGTKMDTKKASKMTVVKTPATPAKVVKMEKPDAAKTKKDGTLDMRYKENKEKAKPMGPMKKDGTPDKRYKANKKG